MKDYTTGRLLHCQLRPDFDPAQHQACRQNGFNLDLESLAAIQEEDEEMKFDDAAALSDDDMVGVSPAKSNVNTTAITW